MDIQAMINAFNAASQQTRAQYQVTIADAIDALAEIAPETPIQYADGKAPHKAMSYRGYYSDLAFDDCENASVGSVLTELLRVHATELSGYKGGDYLMDDDTPVWRSEYGTASGVAWIEISVAEGRALIFTKQID